MGGSWRPATLITIAMVALLVPHPVWGVEQGLPFVTFYSPRDYSAGTQNWAATQGQDGVMYFGNDGVVLTFDGARWEQVPVTPGMAVRSLARARDGRILVGLQGDFGYLREFDDGTLSYVSLVDRLPEDAPAFTDIWQVLVDGDDWYFSSAQALFHLGRDEVNVHVHDGHGAGGSFKVDGRLYTDTHHMGLSELRNGSYHPVADSLTDRAIYALLPTGDGRLVIGTRQSGLRILDPNSLVIEELDTESSRYLAEHQIYHGTQLPDGSLAFATLRGGLVLVDLDNDHFQVINRDRGMPDNRLRHLYVDRDEGLWIALDSGIARLDLQSAISRWDLRTGLDGAPLSLARYGNRLYVGTTLGLYVLDRGHFKPIDGIDTEVWSLRHWLQPDGAHALIAATSYGIHAIVGLDHELISEGYLSMDTAVVPTQPDRLWVATYDQGLGYLNWDRDSYTATEFVDLPVPGRRLDVDPDGHLWLETWLDGLYRIDPKNVNVLWQFPQPGSETFGGDLTFLINERQQLIASRNGIWQWLEDGSVIARGDLRSHLIEPMTGSKRMVESEPDLVWSIATDGITDRLRVAQLGTDGQHHPVDTQLGRLPDVEFYVIFPDRDQQVWVGGSDALYQIDLTQTPIGAGQLEVFWRGARAGPRALAVTPGNLPTVLDRVADFPLKLRFSAPVFDWPEGTRYRYRLLPNQADWSEWQSAAEREFSHLPPGEYRFEVQARDSFDRIATTDPFTFIVPPPWYLTSHALGLATLLFAAMIPALLWFGGRRQAWRNQQLEAMVADRTRQLHEQQTLLETERDKLAFLSNHDELTGLANRRQGNARLREAWRASRQTGRPMSLALVDIDHFKLINDRYGHDAGDQVLIEIAAIFKSSLRPEDIVARWGGEEFLLLFPDTGLGDAAAICHRISEQVSSHHWSERDPALQVSISAGVTAGRGQHGPETLLSRADELLYRAKQRGRQCVEVERESW
jgi:diguanylate cyclase (GGDEF)-like protein